MKKKLAGSLFYLTLQQATCGCDKLAYISKSDKKDSKNEKPNEMVDLSVSPETWESIEGIVGTSAGIKQEFRLTICTRVTQIGLPPVFADMISIICTNGEPNDKFVKLDRLAEASGNDPKIIKINSSQTEDGFTQGLFATGYKIRIKPGLIKYSDLINHITKPMNFSYAKTSGIIIQDLREELGGDLQFRKWLLKFEMSVKTPDKTEFKNTRETELGLYQIEGGNTDLGVAVEYLTGKQNEDFRNFKTITVLATNPEQGSTLIAIASMTVKNNGYNDLVSRAFSDIARTLAKNVQEGIAEDLEAGKIKSR